MASLGKLENEFLHFNSGGFTGFNAGVYGIITSYCSFCQSIIDPDSRTIGFAKALIAFFYYLLLFSNFLDLSSDISAFLAI